MQTQKSLNLKPKMIDLGTFGMEIENYFVIFEISTIEFVQLVNFADKKKCLNLGSKMRYLGVLGLEFQKKILLYLK